MNIVVWVERAPAEQSRGTKKAYPDGMQAAIASLFDDAGHQVTMSWQSQADDGLPQALLRETDVLFYWAHCMHDQLHAATVERIAKRVEEGMGIIFLHSAHFSKPFQKLMGTSGSLHWREDGKQERLYNIQPKHPIAFGLPSQVYIPKDEMYGEPFDIPTPDDTVFIGWFPGGEVFRSGFTYHYGKGRIFYFQPGHETFPVYYDPCIRKILHNACTWVSGGTVPGKPYAVAAECKFKRALETGIKLRIKKENF